MFDLAQTVAKRQSELLKEAFSNTESMMKGFDSKKQPQAYMDDAKAVREGDDRGQGDHGSRR